MESFPNTGILLFGYEWKVAWYFRYCFFIHKTKNTDILKYTILKYTHYIFSAFFSPIHSKWQWHSFCQSTPLKLLLLITLKPSTFWKLIFFPTLLLSELFGKIYHYCSQSFFPQNFIFFCFKKSGISVFLL